MDTYTIHDLMNDSSIKIPEHQRPEMWTSRRQQTLAETIMAKRPMPNLTIRETGDANKKTRWLEDGQQRYISMKKFIENNLSFNSSNNVNHPLNGKYYKDFTDAERLQFLMYKIFVLKYENASYDDTIAIFDTFQNGVSLSPGQRFHARLETPLVKYARDRLLTPGTHFYQRISEIWGVHKATDDTKTKKLLVNAMAIAGGIVHGAEFITTSYDILGPKLHVEFNAEEADAVLEKVISIYEAVDSIYNITPADKKKQWDAGKITGYILYSLIQYPEREEELVERWTEYLVNVRDGSDTIKILHHNMPASRNWNSSRWSIGYKNIFEVRPELTATEKAEESEDEE